MAATPPPGYHRRRWTLLTIWLVAFTLAGALSFWIQQRDQAATSDRLCKVTDAFIGANLRLQDAQGKQALQLIGLRQEVLRANQEALVALAHSKAPATRAFMSVLLAQDSLNRAANVTTREVQKARSAADAVVAALRRRLNCGPES